MRPTFIFSELDGHGPDLLNDPDVVGKSDRIRFVPENRRNLDFRVRLGIGRLHLDDQVLLEDRHHRGGRVARGSEN